ncbi:MAG: DUF1289 domain-containing protein [Pseudomonadota bacterium]|nr:DUF1289 domain-containing protein [Pseudomonadota bacterium]
MNQRVQRPDDAALGAAVPSPCTNVCSLDARSGWCLGCRRSLDEIAAWSRLTDAEKRAVWDALPTREVGTR